MVLAYLHNLSTYDSTIQSAANLAVTLKKELDILVLADKEKEETENQISAFIQQKNIQPAKIIVSKNSLSELSEICEEHEASFLLLQLTDNRSKNIQTYLKVCRGLRIPYLIYKDDFPVLDIKKVLVPVTFLEEDYEKAQFASAFGRFYNAHITLLLANDYGTKASVTAGKMEQLFGKFELSFEQQKASKDSFKVEKEAVQIAENEQYDIILISASREYGLDDILFGPKEQHIVKSSGVPVLLINPRGDLYALCD